MLNTQIGAPIPDSPAAPIIVRRHYVWHAINLQKLQETALAYGMPIVHCKAEVVASHGLSLHQLYSIIQGPKKATRDRVLSLISGAPLMITKTSTIFLCHWSTEPSSSFMGSVTAQINIKLLQLSIFLITCSSDYCQGLMIKAYISLGSLQMWSLFGQSLLNTMQDMVNGRGYSSFL